MTIPTYRSTESRPADRGRAFGQAFAPAVANTVTSYRRLFWAVQGLELDDIRRKGTEVGETLSAQFPDLVEEIAGISAGAGQDEREMLAINARTEILGGGADADECSTVGFLPDITPSGSLFLAQNWDWYGDQAASKVIWTVVEPGGRWFTTLTEAGILAKIGLSSVGLGVCLNLLATTVDGGTSGLPVHVLLRLLLQRCDSLGQALAFILGVPVSASSCLTIGYQDDGGGMLVAAELSPGGVGLVWPGQEGWLVHTNHFLQSVPIGEDRYAEERPGTLIRYHHLERLLLTHRGHFSPDDAKTVLRSHFNAPLAVCCHDVVQDPILGPQGTLSSVAMDLAARTMQVTDGSPCHAPYEDVPVPVPVHGGLSTH